MCRSWTMEVYVGNLGKSAIIASILVGLSTPAAAQSNDMSPTLLIESMPSDNPKYRRMVFVRYLSGASYKAYNRREFNLATSSSSSQNVAQCANGAATSLRDIKSFAKAEKRLARGGQAPEVSVFCIKNVPNWTAKNKNVFLDPIFEGMPYVAPQGR